MKKRTIFTSLNLKPEIQRAITDMGFEEASPIQEEAIPVMLEGRDLIGQAQTGTGKTAAFGIPLLENIDPENKSLQAIVLCPTRELAIQVADEIRRLGKYLHGIKTLPIYGGQPIVGQIKALKKGTQIVIGTPGRVMDHMRRKTIRMDQLHTIVLDEADEMLNMGFREDIETILQGMPKDRQTVLFSATMPRPIMEITKEYQTNAKVIKVTKKELTTQNIEQMYFEVKGKEKEEAMERLLHYFTPELSVVFCNTKKQVDILVNAMNGMGFMAEGLHGDMKQEQRDRVMKRFRMGTTKILVATDVAARGIDVDEVEAVFNYDLPQDDEYYVHRIGRTGRAGRSGRAFSFISRKEKYRIRQIERYCKTSIPKAMLPSRKDVKRIKMEQAMTQVKEVMNEGQLGMYMEAIKDEADKTGATVEQIAAALLKMYTGKNEAENNSKKMESVDTGAKDAGMIRLFVNVGKKHRARPGDLVGAVAGESHIPGEEIGSVEMFDKFSFVEVPIHYGKQVVNAMQGVKIRGKMVACEAANPR